MATKKLINEGLRPALKELVKISPHVNLDSLLDVRDDYSLILDLRYENTGKQKVVGYDMLSARRSGAHSFSPSILSTPQMEDVYKYMVSIGHLKKGSQMYKEIFVLDLPGVENETDGTKEIGLIAKDIKSVYNLPYNPLIYKQGHRIR